MPSAKSGKHTIKNIKVNQKHITITFFKSEKIQISPEAYLSSYLYKGKTLSEDDINKLQAITSSSALLSYVLNLVSRRPYSEKEIIDKLKRKEAGDETISQIISKLKANNLINDELFAQNLVYFDRNRNLGKNKIIRHLKEKGINEGIINNLDFPEEEELEQARLLVPKLAIKYVSLAFENQKRHLCQALVARGYSLDIARQAINFLESEPKENELAKLKEDYDKITKRFARKYKGYELKQKIYRALVNKGYQYQDIKQVMEDIQYENDC